ncbi:tetratricopeptide repeat protein [Candidatus Micrarchaeota archaeon]|nr:tetratricopeptide repeat protein [Candidatus Micrarchaeota archaeon]
MDVVFMTDELSDDLIARNEEQLDEHKIEEAVETADEILKLNPDDAIALYIYGRSLYMKEQFEDALSYLSKAAEIDNKQKDIWQVIGYCLIAMGRYDEAIEPLEYVVSVDPENVEASYALGITYLIIGDKRYDEMITKAFKLSKERAARLADQVYTKYISKSKEVDAHTKSVIERILSRIKMPNQI